LLSASADVLDWNRLSERKFQLVDQHAGVPGQPTTPGSRTRMPELSGTPPKHTGCPPIKRANQEAEMTFGKGALLWLIGIPLPIILLLALFWR
jgi:hypothetical protein